MNSRLKFTVVMTSTCLVLLLIAGSMLGRSAAPDGAYRHLAVYTDVLSRIRSEYVEEPDMKSVTLGALNGLLESVDPFASYLNADQYKEYLKNRDAYQGDVGLVLSKRFGYIGVVDSMPGSPADKAGLVTGDMLESIKGVSTRDMPLAYANLLLRGDPGSTIEMTVLRRRPEPQKITLTRAVISSPAVVSKMMPEEVGYVRPETLDAEQVKRLAAAVSDLQKRGAKKLVLDLRSCGVGNPEDGVAAASLFIDSGLLTYAQGQRWQRRNFEADPSKVISRLPLAVLTNRGTADAAEVAAGALQDGGRAQLIGERTYGDASVRRAITTDDGGAIILSVAKYYTPSGKAIQDTGVTPANAVTEPEPQADTEDDDNPRTESQEKPAGDDVILKKAIEILAGKTTASSNRR